MKNLDLTSYGVAEMTQQELVNVEGGSWLSDLGKALKAIGKAIEEFGEWLEKTF
jgi:hypothetical protein